MILKGPLHSLMEALQVFLDKGAFFLLDGESFKSLAVVEVQVVIVRMTKAHGYYS